MRWLRGQCVALSAGLAFIRPGDDGKQVLEGLEIATVDSGVDYLLYQMIAGDERGVCSPHRGLAFGGRGIFCGEAMTPPNKPGFEFSRAGLGAETAEGAGKVEPVTRHQIEKLLGKFEVAGLFLQQPQFAGETCVPGGFKVRLELGEQGLSGFNGSWFGVGQKRQQRLG